MLGKKFDVAVIGGGFSGTLVALHILRHNPLASVALIDTLGAFGKGLAYSAHSDTFKLNVCADSMGAYPDAPDGFFQWLNSSGYVAEPKDFVPRSWYGKYIESLLSEFRSDDKPQRLTLLNDTVESLLEYPQLFWSLALKNGGSIQADAIVLALGNLPRRSFQGISATHFLNPFDRTSYQNLASYSSLLVVGAGLTAVDFILESEAQGYHGMYTVISRHGRLPLPYDPSSKPVHCNFLPQSSLRRVAHEAIQVARSMGSSQPVIEGLRPKLQNLWLGLSDQQRSQFLRHLRPLWEVHRHRIPPQHHGILQKLMAKGRLSVQAAQLISFSPSRSAEPDEALTLTSPVHTTLKLKKSSETISCLFDAAALCVGPDLSVSNSSDPFLQSLIAHGILKSGIHGLGVSIVQNSSRPPVALIGPLQKETLWEITAVRELRDEAAKVAKAIAYSIAPQR